VAFGCFAVPPAIFELLTKKARDDGFHVLVEVNTEHDGSAVYAGFHLTTEKSLSGVLPAAVILY